MIAEEYLPPNAQVHTSMPQALQPYIAPRVTAHLDADKLACGDAVSGLDILGFSVFFGGVCHSVVQGQTDYYLASDAGAEASGPQHSESEAASEWEGDGGDTPPPGGAETAADAGGSAEATAPQALPGAAEATADSGAGEDAQQSALGAGEAVASSEVADTKPAA